MAYPRIELVPGTLAFEVRSQGMRSVSGISYFTTCLQFPNLPGEGDLGLANISEALKSFVVIQNTIMRCRVCGGTAVFYSPCVPCHIINGASTLGLYLVLYLNFAPQTVVELFAPIWSCFERFQEIFSAECTVSPASPKRRIETSPQRLLKPRRANLLNILTKRADYASKGGISAAFEGLIGAAWCAQHCCVFSVRAFSAQMYDFYFQRQNGSFVELLQKRLFGFVVAFECGLRQASFKELLYAANVRTVLCSDSLSLAGSAGAPVEAEIGSENAVSQDFELKSLAFEVFPSCEQLQVIYRLFTNGQQPFAVCSVSDLRRPAVVMCIILVKFYKFKPAQAVLWACCIVGGVLGPKEVGAIEQYGRQLEDEYEITLNTQTEPHYGNLEMSKSRELDCLRFSGEENENCTYELLNSNKINLLAKQFVNISAKQLKNKRPGDSQPPKIRQLPPCRYIIKAGKIVEAGARKCEQEVKTL